VRFLMLRSLRCKRGLRPVGRENGGGGHFSPQAAAAANLSLSTRDVRDALVTQTPCKAFDAGKRINVV
jgi:hypothetical protein